MIFLNVFPKGTGKVFLVFKNFLNKKKFSVTPKKNWGFISFFRVTNHNPSQKNFWIREWGGGKKKRKTAFVGFGPAGGNLGR